MPLAVGGQGFPGVGFIPGDVLPLLLPWLPEVEGFELEDPEVAPFAVPGKVPQGEPLGEVPGVVVVLGLTVEGCVALPGVAVLGEFDPGAVVLGLPLGEVEPGLVEPGVVCPGVACGVAAPVGGLTLPVGGVAVEPAVELCPALLEPLAGAAPPGAAWATAQLAQHNKIDSKVSFGDDMMQHLQAFLNCPSLYVRQLSDNYSDPVCQPET